MDRDMGSTSEKQLSRLKPFDIKRGTLTYRDAGAPRNPAREITLSDKACPSRNLLIQNAPWCFRIQKLSDRDLSARSNMNPKRNIRGRFSLPSYYQRDICSGDTGKSGELRRPHVATGKSRDIHSADYLPFVNYLSRKFSNGKKNIVNRGPKEEL